MSNCNTIRETLKELKRDGATNEELRQAKQLLEMVAADDFFVKGSRRADIEQTTVDDNINELEDPYSLAERMYWDLRNEKDAEAYSEFEEVNDGLIQDINNQEPRIAARNGGYKVKIQVTGLTGDKFKYRYVTGDTLSNKEYSMKVSDSNVRLKNSSIEKIVYNLYGNTEESLNKKIRWDEFDEVNTKVHGNIEGMKDFVDKLHEAGGRKEDAAYLDYVKELFDKLDPKFFENMTTYITEGAETLGGVAGKKIWMTTSNRGKYAGNESGEVEVYAHEVWHSITTFAVNSGHREAERIKREMAYVMKVVAEELKWQDLLPLNSIDKAKEEDIAKKMYKYILTSENAMEEFIAHAVTNPILKSRLEKIQIGTKKEPKTVLEKIVDFLDTLVKVVLGEYKFNEKNNNAYEQTLKLSLELAEINNKAARKAKENESLVSKMYGWLDRVDATAAHKVQDMMDKILQDDAMKTVDILPANASKLEKAVWMAKFLKTAAVNKNYRKYFGLVASSFGLNPEGLIRDVVSEFFTKDDNEQLAEWLSLAANRIDEERFSEISATKSVVLESFKQKLTEDEEGALTRVLLDTDTQSIYGKNYKNKDIRELLTNDDVLVKKLNRAKRKIRKLSKSGKGDWNVNQAVGLGYFMATGKGHKAQNTNSVNIARGLLSDEYGKVNWKLVQALDEVATLTAIQYTSREQKETVARIMKDEYKGVEIIVNLHKTFIKESKKAVFQDSTTHMMKGYSREVFDDSITMEIAPVNKQKEMEDRGFKLVSEVSNDRVLKNAPKMAMYVSDTFTRNEWQRAATRLTKMGTRGTTLEDIHYKSGSEMAKTRASIDKIRLDQERLKISEQMMAGEMDIEGMEYGMMPVLDEDGDVVSYRYMIEKGAKEYGLKQDIRVSEVLGRSYGNILDKKATIEHNKKVLKVIQDDMDANWIEGTTLGKDGEEYRLIGPDSTDSKIKELYQILPYEFKEHILNREDRVIAVPAGLMNTYFGYRHASLANIPGLEKILPKMVKSAIHMAEAMWQEMIKIYKTNILMKMPFILVGNIFSNMIYALTTGTSPGELVDMYTDSFRDVRKHIKDHREKVVLEAQLKGLDKAKHPAKARKLRMKIRMLDASMKDSPVHELFELGMYQAIVEDVDLQLESTNRWKKEIDKKLEKVPEWVRTPLQVAYISEDTKYYKFNQEVLQMSDLVARDVQNRKMKRIEQEQVNGERELPEWFKEKYAGEMEVAGKKIPENGKIRLIGKRREQFLKEAKKFRSYQLLEDFINYDKPSSSTEEYLNKMGAVLFTKYAKRIQRIISKGFVNHPIKSALVMLTDGFLLDIESIQGQSLMTRSWYNIMGDPNDGLPFQSHIDQAMEVLTPAIVKFDTTYRVWP